MRQSTEYPNTQRERGKYRTACQPCSRRKIRCDRDTVQPCSNCVKRNQPGLCDLGSQSQSRAQPHHASSRDNNNTTSAAKRQSKRLSLVQDQLEQPTTQQPSPWTTQASTEVRSSTSSNIVSPTTVQQDDHGQLNGSPSKGDAMPNVLDGILEPADDNKMPSPSHIGEPAMATYIRHQANSTGFALTDSVSSMLGLLNRDAGYPLLDLGGSEDRWTELEPILPRPAEIWR